ncbi:EAL domain-containing protein [Sphingomonas sp. PB2P19]|uniref:sensor domain-containing protein n=1 Tax=Sphingomonas rhamnosi TaxID=3096156 RepID=UPI002FCC8395
MQHLPTRELLANGTPESRVLSGADAELIATVARYGTVARTHGELETVLGRARVGILHRRLDFHVLVVNEAYCALVGRSAEVLEGLPFQQFTHPDDVDRSDRTFTEHLATAEPFEIEKRYVRPDGSVVWCAVHVSFVLDAAGQPESTIVVASDITARRTAEQRLRESEEHLRYTVELNPQITWTAAPDGAVLEVSERWFEVTGVRREDALGERWVSALHPDDVAETRRQWAQSIATGCPVDVEYRLMTGSESFRWFRSRAAARTDAMGRVVRWYGTLEDIHDRRLAQDELRESETRFRLAARAAKLGIWDYDAVRNQREWSDDFKTMLGLPVDTTAEIATAYELVVPADRHLLIALVDAAQAGDSTMRFDDTLRICRANDGAQRWMRTAGWRMYASSGRLTRVLVTIRDVTDERTAEDRIRWTATHDALTCIPNRAFFTEHLEQAIASATPESRLALVLLDVDRLKEINDTIGHDAGDMLLKTFAGRLDRAFAPCVVTGRLGGDEFAVLLQGGRQDDLAQRVSAGLEVLGELFEYEGHACETQATAGLSLYPADGETAAELLKSADIALYAGKAGRRGELSVFEPVMRAGMQRRASMLNVARIAVRDDRVVPFYQPKIALDDGRIVGFEALLRWQHDTLGIQGPHTIAAAFDDLRLAAALSDRMIDAVACDLRRWLDAGFDPGRIAINLSPADFRHDRLVERVLAPLERHGVAPSRIDVEITETVLLGRDTDKVATTLAIFHDAGVQIALDDFGTGYASLTHLKMFPVDVIKIDRSFVSRACEHPDDAAIVEAIIGLAHRLQMKIVAEGVERQEQARYLAQLGCTYGQGYLFGRAVPAAAVTELLRSGRSVG